MTPITNTANSNTAAVTAAAVGNNNAFATGSVEATQDRFLRLLVAQIRNQDPLNPLQNSEVTSQLAQLSTVTGINRLSELVGGLSASFAAAQSLQATNLIGRGVLAPGNSIALAQGSAIGAVELPQAVDQLTVTIRSAAGATLYTANLGPQAGGLVNFQWDGAGDNGNAVADGIYTFAVEARAAGQPVADVAPLAFGRVNSVSLSAQGAQLNVDGLGAISLSQVKQIL